MDANAAVWATAVSTHPESGRQIIWRFIETFAPGFDLESLPERVIITWHYASETGQPIKDDYDRMVHFEELLEPVEDSGEFASLALVSTGENLREWTYQTKSGDEFIARLTSAMRSETRFPIEIHVAADPGWSMYKEFRSGVVDTKSN